MSELKPVPPEVAQLLSHWVYKAHSDAQKYENVEVLDEDQVWSLHALLSQVYVLGWDTGFRSADEVRRAQKSARDGGAA